MQDNLVKGDSCAKHVCQGWGFVGRCPNYSRGRLATTYGIQTHDEIARLGLLPWDTLEGDQNPWSRLPGIATTGQLIREAQIHDGRGGVVQRRRGSKFMTRVQGKESIWYGIVEKDKRIHGEIAMWGCSSIRPGKDKPWWDWKVEALILFLNPSLSLFKFIILLVCTC